MPRKQGAPQLVIQVSPEQHQLVIEAAAQAGVGISEFIRTILALHIPGFDPSQVMRPGTYPRESSEVVKLLDKMSNAEHDAWLEANEG